MDPGSRDRIADLHDRALECAPEERRAFLENACNGDHAVLEEVESLLRYESDAARFLETPAAVAAGDLARTPDRSQIVGRQLGPYTIVAPLGAGGMGEVYRAHDSKLGRDVAIKILPSQFTADPERRSRFAREARLLATLNHPHIGAIYGLEDIDGAAALILELVEGPSLADRLTHGPLPIAEALAIARQLADALDAAHEHGIVHRDLKPANIVLRGATKASGLPSSDPHAKVLDFGLAKTIAVWLDNGLIQPSGSGDGTADGRILGTPTYMSPEQVRGQAVDKRTDIWAFGCVLYEMLAGRPPFGGETMSDTFVSILEREPDWAALPAPQTPSAIRTLLERCLRKDPRNRLHDIADALIEIDDRNKPTAWTASAFDAAPEGSARGRERLGWVVAAALAVALGGTVLLTRRHAPAEPTLVEFPILPPEGSKFTKQQVEFAVSPDGRDVAFIANSKSGSSLWVRSLAAVDPRPLRGTEGARNPFWSPDSQSIGFFAGNQLKTVLASGEAAVVPYPGSESHPPVMDAIGGAPSGTWSSQDIVVFGPSNDGSLRQTNMKRGGMPTPVTTRETAVVHRRPKFLPDGQRFLYLSGQSELRVGSLTTADTIVIGTFESPAVYSAGHLLFTRGGNLMAQPFNEETLRLDGNPVPLRVQVSVGMPGYSASPNGPLVFLPPPTTEPQLTWLDRDGRRVGLVGDTGVVGGNLDLSPDGQHVAFSSNDATGHSDIWLMEVATGRATPLTDNAAGNTDAAWSPHGKHIVFNSSRLGGLSLFLRASDGSGVDVPLVKYEKAVAKNFAVASWSRADVLIFNAYDQSDFDLWTLSMSGHRTPKVFLSSKHSEMNGTFSPDGRWVAYQSNASGRYEVIVRPYPNKDPAQTISHDGGKYPRWRGDGKELFFVSPDGTLMAAVFDAVTGRSRGVPQPLFATQIRFGDNRPYAVDKFGQRFLLKVAPDPRLVAVMDWRALVNRTDK
jgi:serine/threonine protein kinase/Tol biopolymer transport system component